MFKRIPLHIQPDERLKAVQELREICTEIGCSGLELDMCLNRPHLCKIIRKLVGVDKYDKPIPYKHPKGAVIWVRI